MADWATDFRHLPPVDAEGVPPAGRRRADFTHEVVEAATSRKMDRPWVSAVKCIARKGRGQCDGCVQVELSAERDEIDWSCTTCDERGVITGFTGGGSDLRRYLPRGRQVNWGVDDEERRVLLEAATEIPEIRAVIARASPHAEIAGLLLIRATLKELDSIYTLVEDLTGLTRSRKRIELLDGLRASLCSSMDSVYI